jgi:hypothetical protein
MVADFRDRDSSTASFQKAKMEQAAPWLILWLSAYNVFLLYSMDLWLLGSACIQLVLDERRDDHMDWMASFRQLITTPKS